MRVNTFRMQALLGHRVPLVADRPAGGFAHDLEDRRRHRLPHFFIIGAPKCGTTALYTYLSGHRSIYMAQLNGRKLEPQFFCTDFPGVAQLSGDEAYQALFEPAPPDSVCGESSAWYLFSEVAVPKLVECVPDAKLIVMLRNPVDMAHSLHGQLVYSLREDVESFEEAWHLQDARRRGERLPRHHREASHLQYAEVCSFAPQLERLFRHVRPDNVKVILNEELAADPRSIYRSVLDFLGVPDDGRMDYPRVNESAAYRNRTVVRLIHRLPRAVDPLLYGAKRTLNRAGARPLGLLKRLNARPQPRASLRPAFRQYLADFFESDIRNTERILARSLQVWRDKMALAPIT